MLSVTTRAMTSDEREKVITRAHLRPRNPIIGGVILFCWLIAMLVLTFCGAILSHMVGMAVDMQLNPTKILVTPNWHSWQGILTVFTNPASYIGAGLVIIAAVVVSINQRHRIRGWNTFQREVAKALKPGEVEVIACTADDAAYIEGSGEDLPGFYLLAVEEQRLLALEETTVTALVQAGTFPARSFTFTRLPGRHEIIELQVDGAALVPSVTRKPLAASEYMPFSGEILDGELTELDSLLRGTTASSTAQEPS